MQSDPIIWNPFAVLGLPEWPDLEDETVHAAWQVIAAETHPDRPDGGNLARYTQATAAYCQLSCPCGRSEAYAGLLEPAWAGGRYDAYPGRPPPGYRLASYLLLADPAETGLGPVPLAEVRRVLAEFPARIRRGHPGRMAVRATVVTGLCLTLLAVFPGDPLAAFAVVVLALVFLVYARQDLAPLSRPVTRRPPPGIASEREGQCLRRGLGLQDGPGPRQAAGP